MHNFFCFPSPEENFTASQYTQSSDIRITQEKKRCVIGSVCLHKVSKTLSCKNSDFSCQFYCCQWRDFHLPCSSAKVRGSQRAKIPALLNFSGFVRSKVENLSLRVSSFLLVAGKTLNCCQCIPVRTAECLPWIYWSNLSENCWRKFDLISSAFFTEKIRNQFIHKVFGAPNPFYLVIDFLVKISGQNSKTWMGWREVD